MKNIDVMVPCGVNSEKYCEFLIQSIESTVSDFNNFNFLLGVNDSSVDIEFLENINSKFDIRVYDCINDQSGGLGHGSCLDMLLPHVTSELGMICDVDTIALETGWDLLLIDEMNRTGASIIGCEYDGNKILLFPNVIGCMFDVSVIKECEVSFMPKSGNITIDSDNCEIYQRECGDTIFLDTGWELCYNLKSRGYSGIPLKIKSPRYNDSCVFMTEDMRGEEYTLNNVPIFSHLGRSSTRSFNDPITVRWRDRFIEYLEKP